MDDQPSSGLLDLDGVRLAWTRNGRRGAISVLLAHGITDSAACWNRIVALLAPSYDVICYDARGHGASGRTTRYPFELHTSDLIRLARALHLDRPVLIGHSMGAAHAAVAAVELDARALILEDPHWPGMPEDGTSHDIAAGRRTLREFSRLPDVDLRARGRAEHPAWADIDLESWLEAQRRVDPNVVSWFDSWPTFNRWRDHVANLDCPGLLLTGDQSPIVTTEAAAEAKSRWPELRTVTIEGAGHNVRRDRFEPYAGAVLRFLDSL